MSRLKLKHVFKRRFYTTSGICLSFFVIMISFQNCSQGGFSSSPSTSPFSDSSNNATSTEPENVKITEPEMFAFSQGQVTIKGTCATGSQIVITGDLATEETDTCVNGLFEATIVLSISDGNKNILVTQTTSSGQTKSDSRILTKDTMPPNLDILNIANGANIGKSIQFTGICENGFSVTIKSGSLTTTAQCQSGMYTGTLNVTTLPDGNLTASASQTDAAGLTTLVTRNLIKDGTPPAINILAPASNAAVSTPFVMAGTCETGLNVIITSQALQNPLSAVCINASFAMTVVLPSSTLGSRQFTATQTDVQNNVGSQTKTYQVIESTVPALNVTIAMPAANTSTKGSLVLSGACQNNLPVTIEGTGIQTTTATCTSSSYSQEIILVGTDGSKQITVSQSNVVSGAKGSASRPYILDTKAPQISVSSPVEGAPSKETISIVGGCETGTQVSSQVYISGSGLSNPTTVGCGGGVYNLQNITLSSGDGVKQIIITQTDEAGNSTTITRNVLKDTTPPVITITSPAEGSTHNSGLTLIGTCESDLNVVATGNAISNLAQGAQCKEGAFSMELQFSDGDGTKTVMLRQIDAAGNATTIQRSFVRKTVVSDPVFSAPFTPLRTLTVCASGCMYTLPSQAIAASQDYDLIEIRGGTYTDCAAVSTNKLWIKGVTSRPHLRNKVCQSKGILITKGSDITIENLEFSGMEISDAEGGNAAGIRGEGQKLTVRNCFFHDGQNGILGGAAPTTGEVIIQNSHFARLGYSGYEHDMYINTVASFLLENSLVEEGFNGNLVKTRAKKTTLQCNKILGGYNSAYPKAAYAVNLPNGGEVIIRNNLIAQGLYTNNRNLMDFGSEGLPTDLTHSLSITNNYLISDASAATLMNMFGAAQAGSTMNNNIFVGTLIAPVGGSAASSLSNVNNMSYLNRTSAGLTQQFPIPAACTKTIGLLPIQ